VLQIAAGIAANVLDPVRKASPRVVPEKTEFEPQGNILGFSAAVKKTLCFAGAGGRSLDGMTTGVYRKPKSLTGPNPFVWPHICKFVTQGLLENSFDSLLTMVKKCF